MFKLESLSFQPHISKRLLLHPETTQPDHEIKAAVAIILIESTQEFLVIRRAAHPKDPWSFQMALPGGYREQNETLLETAIRECFEECQIELKLPQSMLTKPKVAGKYAQKKLLVKPFVFKLEEKPEVLINQEEVSHYYWVDIEHFCDSSRHKNMKMSRNHPTISFPCFQIGTDHIWGFTYAVLIDYFDEMGKGDLKQQVMKMSEIDQRLMQNEA